MTEKTAGNGKGTPVGGATTGVEFDATLARAVAAMPQAHKLLGIAAYLAPRRIPLAIVSSAVMTEAERRAALGALSAARLAQSEEIDSRFAAFSVAPAVQKEMRTRLAAASEETGVIALAVRLVADAYPAGDDAGEAMHWPLCERLGEHAQAVLAHAPDDGAEAAATSDLLHHLSQYLFARGRYEEAEPLVRRSGAIHELICGTEHPAVGQDRANLAIVLYELGRTEEALPHIRRAMAIGEAELGPEHPDVAERYNILATLLESLRRPAQADPFIRHALLVAERMLGTDHPDTQLYRANYERIVAAIDVIARKDADVEAGLVIASPERLARPDIPAPPVPRQRGLLGRLGKLRTGRGQETPDDK